MTARPAAAPDAGCPYCSLRFTGSTQRHAMSAAREHIRGCRPRCSSCLGRVLWADDAWICVRCGDEWCEDHDLRFAPPGSR